jgi:hypothetical protein
MAQSRDVRFLAAHLSANPNESVIYDALGADKKVGIKKRLVDVLKGVDGTKRPVNKKGAYSDPPIPITTDADAHEDLSNEIVLAQYSYHDPTRCEENFETLVRDLNKLLADNTILGYNNAIDRVNRCIEGRVMYEVRSQQQPNDLGHATMIALLRLLVRELTAARDTVPLIPKRVVLWQYMKSPTATKGTIYNFTVENIAPTPDIQTQPFNQATIPGYETIKNNRLVTANDPDYQAAVRRMNAVALPLGPPGGRRTRRRRAFKKHPKKSRKRMSRRA